jgi:hypothetical protein
MTISRDGIKPKSIQKEIIVCSFPRMDIQVKIEKLTKRGCIFATKKPSKNFTKAIQTRNKKQYITIHIIIRKKQYITIHIIIRNVTYVYNKKSSKKLHKRNTNETYVLLIITHKTYFKNFTNEA